MTTTFEKIYKMNIKPHIFILLLMMFFACGAKKQTIDKPLAENAVLDISSWNFDKNGSVPLAGKWEFYWKQLIAPNEFDSTLVKNATYCNMPGYWESVSVGDSALSNVGYATYRLIITSDTDKKLSMFIAEQMTAYSFWCNNNLIYESGHVADNAAEAVPKRAPVILDVNLRKGKNELVFQISNFNHRLGGFYLAPVLGTYVQLHYKRELQQAFDIFLVGSLFIMGLYFLLLFLIKSSVSGTFYIGLFSILLAIRTSLTGTLFLLDVFPDWSWDTQYRIEYLVSFIAPLVMLYFIQSLYKNETNAKVVRVFSFLFLPLILSIILPPIVFTQLLAVEQALMILIVFYVCWSLIVAAKRKRSGIKTLFATIFIYASCIANDTFVYVWEVRWGIELVPIGTLILVLGQIMALTRIFSVLMRDNEVLSTKLEYRNKNLDVMVQEKTQTLRMQQNSLLEKNKELKKQNEKIKSISSSLAKQNYLIQYRDNQMRNLLKMLPEAIFEIDSAGQVLHANEEFYKYLKYEQKTKPNINQFLEVEEEEQVGVFQKIQEKIGEEKIIKNLNLDVRRSDNSKFPALFSIIEHIDNEGIKYRCMFMDITSQLADENKIISAYQEISKKNKDITDSIEYASKMQKAVMPAEEIFAQTFSDYFIINRPRNIVSGDFYYINKIGNKVVFALSDCTGHGVPGGFMTILGITLLNKLYGSSSSEIPSPDYALGVMREQIIESLDQKNESYSNKDGMDIILCVLDTDTLVLEFASANQPLLIMRDGEITTIKGDPMPLGIYLVMKEFTLKQVQLNKNDVLYLFSDGIVDSFGGERDRKLHLKGFRNMIMDCNQTSMKKQCECIENKFDTWKGTQEQIDDILVLGVKIS